MAHPTQTPTTAPTRAAAICRGILRPVTDNPRFFIAALLAGAAVPWIFAITQGAKILWLMLFATIQSATLAYLLCLLVGLIGNRRVRLAAKAAVMLILGVALLAEAASIAMTGAPLDTDSVNLLLETNRHEASGFFSQYLTLKAAATIILTFAAIIAIAALFRLTVNKLKKNRGGQMSTRAIAAAILLAILLAGGARLAGLLRPLCIDDYRELLEWAAQDPGNPVLIRTNQLRFGDPLSKWTYIVRDISLQRRNIPAWEQTQRDLLGMPVSGDGSRDFNIIIIIGESFIRAHTPLYGYYLPTTPRLCREEERGSLVVFADMIAPANFTTTSMRNFLNLNDLSAGEEWTQGGYFPLVVKKAGWKVAHYDNQTVSRSSDAGISRMIYSPVNLAHTYDQVSDTLFDYDGDFTTYVNARLRPRDMPGKKMVTYHLWGQHFAAADRFPGTPRFSAADITADRPWLDDKRRQEVADYDSATYYNDSVVGAIIDYWRDTPALVVYFSDHGEDCWDLAPVVARNKPMPDDPAWLDRQYHVPFLVWMSDSFRAAHPDLEARIREAATRRGTLDNLGQAIIGLAGIQAPCYRPDRDITSPAYRPGARVTAEGYRFDDQAAPARGE